MKPAPFHYARPSMLTEVHALLAEFGEEARLLAGGQGLVPLLSLRRARPAVVVDLGLVDELRVLAREPDELVIGAGVRLRAVETSSLLRDACRLVPLAARHVGHPQIRARATVGGSLAYAHPAGELAGVAVATDAVLVATSSRGRRVIAARDFFLGPHETALGHDEVLTEVRLPVRSDTRYAFLEVGRAGCFGTVAVAAAVRLAGEREIAEAQLVAVGARATPLRLTSAEAVARASPVGASHRARIAAAAAEDAAFVGGSDQHASGRRRIVATLVSRALAEVAA